MDQQSKGPGPGEPVWAVVLVHGVGITKPGHTVEKFLTTLTNSGNMALTPTAVPEVRLLEDHPSAQPRAYTSDDPLAGRFPMHLCSAHIDSRSGDAPEWAVFTEVYWADLSAANRGFWDWGGWSQTLFRMFTLLFQLRFVGHMAATHPGLKSAYLLRLLVFLGSWLLCGPIAGPNAFMFFLLAAHFLTERGREGLALLRDYASEVQTFLSIGPWICLVVGVGFLWYYLRHLGGQPWAIPRARWGLGGLVLCVVLVMVLLTKSWTLLGGGLIMVGVSLWVWGRRDNWSVKALLVCAGLTGWGVALCLGNALTLELEPAAPFGPWRVATAEVFAFGGAGAIFGVFCLRLLFEYETDRIWWTVLFWFICSAVAAMALAVCLHTTSPETLQAGWVGDHLSHYYGLLVETTSALNIVLAVLLSWVVGVFVVLGGLMGVGLLVWFWAFFTSRGPHAPARPALTAAFVTILLQIGLWVLLVPLLGMAALYYMDREQLTSENSLFARVWTRFAFNMSLGILVIVVALFVHVIRRWRAERYSHVGDTLPDTAPSIPRLIANPWMMGAIITVSMMGFASFLIAILFNNDLVHQVLRGYQGKFVFGGLVVLGLAMLVGRQGLLAGLHVLRDVVGHFYRPHIPIGELLRPVPPQVDPNQFGEQFRLEQEIEYRFQMVLKELMRSWKVRRLTVVSHSQGTVVAIHSLYPAATRDLLSQNGVGDIQLVTMGSPFTHLYQHYFPYRYPSLYNNPSVDPDGFNTQNWQALRALLSRWVNVFRVDDFVGTRIEGSQTVSFPANEWVPGSGHTGYWVDAEVVRAIHKLLPGG